MPLKQTICPVTGARLTWLVLGNIVYADAIQVLWDREELPSWLPIDEDKYYPNREDSYDKPGAWYLVGYVAKEKRRRHRNRGSNRSTGSSSSSSEGEGAQGYSQFVGGGSSWGESTDVLRERMENLRPELIRLQDNGLQIDFAGGKGGKGGANQFTMG